MHDQNQYKYKREKSTIVETIT